MAVPELRIVCIDRDGVSRFYHLLDHKHEPVLYAFDLLWHDGVDLRQQPLWERKQRLEQLVRKSGLRIVYAQHVEKDGKDLFREICARDLEGVVAKRKWSVYRDDGTGWLKIKNRTYSQAEGRHELLTRIKRSPRR
jgi:bifunctional non-homologous end joining protein LigD